MPICYLEIPDSDWLKFVHLLRNTVNKIEVFIFRLIKLKYIFFKFLTLNVYLAPESLPSPRK